MVASLRLLFFKNSPASGADWKDITLQPFASAAGARWFFDRLPTVMIRSNCLGSQSLPIFLCSEIGRAHV